MCIGTCMSNKSHAQEHASALAAAADAAAAERAQQAAKAKAAAASAARAAAAERQRMAEVRCHDWHCLEVLPCVWCLSTCIRLLVDRSVPLQEGRARCAAAERACRAVRHCTQQFNI